MFKKFEISTGLPSIADLQEAARLPGKLLGYAKIFLFIWLFFWIAGMVVRVMGTVKLMRREQVDDDLQPTAPRPVYALFNFTIHKYGDKA